VEVFSGVWCEDYDVFCSHLKRAILRVESLFSPALDKYRCRSGVVRGFALLLSALSFLIMLIKSN
jgi:hypothetical protein